MQVRIFSSADRYQLAATLEDFIQTREAGSEINFEFSTAIEAPCIMYSVLVVVRKPRRAVAQR